MLWATASYCLAFVANLSFSVDLWIGIFWQWPGLKIFSSSLFWVLHPRLQLLWDSMRALSLFMVFSWLNILEGSSIWTLGLFLGLFMRHGAYFVRPSPTNLLKRRWFYLLNYLFLCMSIKINPWACALASLVGQDLWLAPALPPNRPWQEFIWSASSLTLGLVPWLLWFGRACGLAPQPDRPWQGFKRRWFYLLNYLLLCKFIKINPWACALASLVWQDLWLGSCSPTK